MTNQSNTGASPMLVVSSVARTGTIWARRYLGDRPWRLITHLDQARGYTPSSGVQFVVVDEPEHGHHSLTEIVARLQVSGLEQVNPLQLMVGDDQGGRVKGKSGTGASSSILGPIAAIALAAGLIAWAWTGTWQWAVTGLAISLVVAAVGANLDARRRARTTTREDA